LLTKLYKEKNNLDSAFYYQQIAMNTKESLFGLDEFHKLQSLVFSEQQRVHQLQQDQILSKANMQRTIFLFIVAIFILTAAILLYSNRQQKKSNYLLNEKNKLIEQQSEDLKKTLLELKSTQSQLIQSEKMASLGELTAGIAHEIQNPLNFVNNFSEVSTELVSELNTEIEKGNTKDAKEIAIDLKQNLEKINHHGKRAAEIVKGMLQHSRTSSGEKELTDINALADEYLRLAYHGLRAKDKSFNAKFETILDPTLPKINVVPQDLGRVILNLINNAFYAVNERLRQAQPDSGYEPTVTVSTKRSGDKIEILVKDNGNGIPKSIKEKIFQPFFTTKPTGQGTGLGLSLSYDIVKAHGGELKVETKHLEGMPAGASAQAGSEFIINIPVI